MQPMPNLLATPHFANCYGHLAIRTQENVELRYQNL
jgi:hypothetical protein